MLLQVYSHSKRARFATYFIDLSMHQFPIEILIYEILRETQAASQQTTCT